MGRRARASRSACAIGLGGVCLASSVTGCDDGGGGGRTEAEAAALADGVVDAALEATELQIAGPDDDAFGDPVATAWLDCVEDEVPAVLARAQVNPLGGLSLAIHIRVLVLDGPAGPVVDAAGEEDVAACVAEGYRENLLGQDVRVHEVEALGIEASDDGVTVDLGGTQTGFPFGVSVRMVAVDDVLVLVGGGGAPLDEDGRDAIDQAVDVLVDAARE